MKKFEKEHNWEFASLTIHDSEDVVHPYELKSIPIMKTPTDYVVAFCDDSPNDAQTVLRTTYNISVNVVFASEDAIENGIDLMFSPNPDKVKPSLAMKLELENAINYEQAIIAQNYSTSENKAEVLQHMGLLPSNETSEAWLSSLN